MISKVYVVTYQNSVYACEHNYCCEGFETKDFLCYNNSVLGTFSTEKNAKRFIKKRSESESKEMGDTEEECREDARISRDYHYHIDECLLDEPFNGD